MNQSQVLIRATLAVMASAVVGVVLGTASVTPAQAEPTQGLSCSWDRSGSIALQKYHAASAVVPEENKVYLFGGVDDSGEVQDTMASLDFTGATRPGDATGRNEARGIRKLFGSAAAYVPSSTAGEKGRIYFMGGSDKTGTDTRKERGSNEALYYDAESKSFSAVTFAGDFGERIFAAAAYDPTNNQIVLTGGVRTCSLVDEEEACGNADTFTTQFIKFDETGSATLVNGPSGGPNNIYGHSLVYDATGNRMIAFGGTRNGSRPSSDLWELPLADPATAKWSSLSAGGRAPTVAFHSAAYDANRNWMVVIGGATTGFMTGSESTSKATFALDLSDPAGANWVDLRAATNPTERVGGSAGYIDNGELMGVVHAAGRTAFDDRDPYSQNTSRNGELLTCEDVVEPTTPPTSPPTTPPPTSDTPGTPVTPTTPPPPPDPEAEACPGLDTQVPAAVIANALGSPDSVSGWKELCQPSKPPSPYNTMRTYLSLRNPGAPYNPLYNSVVYTCGCR